MLNEFSISDINDEQYIENKKIAIMRYIAGDDSYGYSVGICDSTTAGYDRLDIHGYWEYPLPVNQDDLTIEVWEL